MEEIDRALNSAVGGLSDENYAQSLDFYRFWFGITQTYYQIPPDQILEAIWKNRGASSIDPNNGQLIHSAAHLIVRFACDVTQNRITFLPHTAPGCKAGSARCYSSSNLSTIRCRANGYGNNASNSFYADATLMAHWANLGFVEEAAIHNHILQSLTSHTMLYDHRVDALIVLFKLAGATFETYADPSVVDRCFELLKGHSYSPPYNNYDQRHHDYHRVRGELVKEVLALRESGWEGLPPPPVFPTGKPKPTEASHKDPAATPVAISLGLPNRGLEPQIPSPLPLGSAGNPGPGTTPETPVTQSPSISIATLSDFTIADTNDDESLIDPITEDASDDELLVDPTAVVRHETFYLEDGNVEGLCGKSLFRVHTTILSFHSPALRRMFTQTSLTTTESPNGCPRILSSDTAKDFSTLLKMIYLPGFPEQNKVPNFATFSSLLRITAKYEMPAVRSQLLEVIRDAYPETFKGLGPSKLLGERVFSGPTPHPNEVLNLFVQQNLTSALPMAYYMASRRGPDSLMDRDLPRDATLSPHILQSAIKGLMALREVELNEAYHLDFESKGSHPSCAPNCPSRTPTSPATLATYRKVFDRTVGSSQLGTTVLQVPEFYEKCEGGTRCVSPGICSSCVDRWESGHAELRRKAWTRLPDVFG